jgi:hypothetical protein
MSVIAATQLTAVSTTALAVFAVVTAIFALLAFRKQREDTEDQKKLISQQGELIGVQQGQLEEQHESNERRAAVLELQARELRASFEQRRRVQAAQVFIRNATPTEPRPHAAYGALVTNSSDQPIYDLVVRWRNEGGLITHPALEPDLMPQTTGSISMDNPGEVPPVCGVTVLFRDAACQCWQTTDRGALTELCGERASRIEDWCQFDPGHEGEHSWEQNPRGLSGCA